MVVSLIPVLREQAADVPGTKLAVVAIVRACFQARAWSALNENILLISKRRSQLKQVRARGPQVAVALGSPSPPAGDHGNGAGEHDLSGRHAGRGR